MKFGAQSYSQAVLIPAQRRLTDSPQDNPSDFQAGLCHPGQTQQRPDGVIVVRLFRRWCVLWCDLCLNWPKASSICGEDDGAGFLINRKPAVADWACSWVEFEFIGICIGVRHSEGKLLPALHIAKSVFPLNLIELNYMYSAFQMFLKIVFKQCRQV